MARSVQELHETLRHMQAHTEALQNQLREIRELLKKSRARQLCIPNSREAATALVRAIRAGF